MKSENIEILKNGGVGVIPTDTIYGLVGSALKPETVKRIAEIKNRSDGKGFIVLISAIKDLKIFGIEPDEKIIDFLNKYWPGKVSVEFMYQEPKFVYLRNQDSCNAFRLPDKKDLIELIKKTGPVVAPSANPEGKPPARNISEAQKYFGNQVDFYDDGGNLDSLPSTLVRVKGDKIEVLRAGAVKVA